MTARVREDVRLENGPMQPVSCQSCGAVVEVRKSTWDQTSVQWHQDALEACLERRALQPSDDGPNSRMFPGCAALRASVREAAVRGELSVLQAD